MIPSSCKKKKIIPPYLDVCHLCCQQRGALHCGGVGLYRCHRAAVAQVAEPGTCATQSRTQGQAQLSGHPSHVPCLVCRVCSSVLVLAKLAVVAAQQAVNAVEIELRGRDKRMVHL